MAEKYFPFASVGGDRKYTAEEWAQYFAPVLTNGVFPVGTQLQVTADEGMNVSLSAGQANINGYRYRNTGPLTLTLDAADGVLHRKDRIVLRWDKTNRQITARVAKGTPASAPVAPAVVRSTDYYDLGLAVVTISAGSTGVLSEHISDTRLDPAVCGIVSSLITPDTDGWYEGWEAEWLTWLGGQQAGFHEWFNELETILDGDIATQLAAQVASLQTGKADRATEYTATLDKDDWSANAPYTQTVNVVGITAGMSPIVDITATTQGELDEWAAVSKIETGAGTITATCLSSKPKVDINIRLKVVY